MTDELSLSIQIEVEAALEALRHLGGSDKDATPLASLLLVRDILAQVREDEAETHVNQQRVIRELLEQALHRLMLVRKEQADWLKDHYWNKLSREQIKRKYKVPKSSSTVRRRWQEGIKSLADLIYQQEMDRRKARQHRIAVAMPQPMYTQLWGRERDVHFLTRCLLDPADHFLIAITGLSGLGKTSLAQELVYTLIPHWHFLDIIWLHAPDIAPIDFTPQELLPVLARHFELDLVARSQHWEEVGRVLRAAPYLVVIDDIPFEPKSVAWLTQLQMWIGPSKFLFTSRTQPPAGQGVFIYNLAPLEQPAAWDLLRHQTARNGVLDWSSATETEIRRFYQAVHGNPQQIRLAAQLAYTTSPAAMFEHLPDQVGEHSTAPYHWAWSLLPKHAKHLLQALRLSTTGGMSDEQLRVVSDLEDHAFWSALFVLQSYCLVDRFQKGLRYQYQIHALTESYAADHEREEIVERSFEQMLVVNCLYWQEKLAAGDVAALELHQAALLRGVYLALSRPSSKQAAIDILLHLYPAIERSFLWRTWLPLFEMAVTNTEMAGTLESFRLLTRVGALYRRDFQLDQALEAYHKAQIVAGKLQRPTAVAKTYLNVGIVYRLQGQYAQSCQHIQAAIHQMEAVRAGSAYLGPAYNTLGLTMYRQGEFVKACDYYTNALSHFEALGNLSDLARTYNNLGNCYLEAGNKDAAWIALSQALIYARQSSFDIELVSLSLANYYLANEQWEEAEESCRSIRIQPGESAPAHVALLDRHWGRLYAGRKAYKPAIMHLQRSLHGWEVLQDHHAMLEVWCFLGHVSQKQGEALLAETYYTMALRLIEANPQDGFMQHMKAKYQLGSGGPK